MTIQRFRAKMRPFYHATLKGWSRRCIRWAVIVSLFVAVPLWNYVLNYSIVSSTMSAVTKTTVLVEENATNNNASQSFPDSVEIVKREGKGWKMWDAKDDKPLFHEKGYECLWANYSSRWNIANKINTTARFCTHDLDIVSGAIHRNGFWSDCDMVVRVYKANNVKNVHHVEIGANIGACVAELLLSDPFAKVVAFEPFPKNLFCLTSTILENPDFHERVAVFPVALVAENNKEGTLSMGMERERNYGSAVLTNNPSKQVGKFRMETVPTERLDDLLHGGARSIKMDAQGSECNILDGGMSHVFSHSLRIGTELDWGLLNASGCSSDGMLKRLRQTGFEMSRYRDGGRYQFLPEKAIPGSFDVAGVNKRFDIPT